MKRAATALAVLVVLSVSLVSCNSYNAASSGTGTTSSKPSGLAVRAFVSNPLAPSGIAGLNGQVLDIVDASLDQLSFSAINVNSAGDDPGMMALSPNKQLLLVYSDALNTIGVVNTLTEGLATGSNGQAITFALPGATESMVIGADNATGYVAVPGAPGTGPNPVTGAVQVLNLTAGTTVATIPVAGARFVAASHNGNRVLVMGETSNTVTVIAPSLIGTANDPRTPVCCFDHPVGGVFSSDDTKAYILDCGPECGGTMAGITVLDMSTDTAGATIPLPGAGATAALMVGNTLYVVGSPPGLPCGSGTAAATCGTLDIVNLSTMTVSNANPVLISDGYHRRMDMSANGQLFIGATTCTNVITSSEVRGCLSIFNTSTAKVVMPPDNGDVTGIQAIANRDVVYVCEGGFFRIYDTTTNKLQVPAVGQNAIIIVGKPTDVKEVD